MPKHNKYRENNSQYIASTGESKIKNDYSAHANIPDHVIIEDMSHEMGRPMAEYEDTPAAMARQFMGDRNKLSGNKPKSRY
jgi:hypothetical protein